MSITTVDFSKNRYFDGRFVSTFNRTRDLLKKVYNCPSIYKAFVKPNDRSENILKGILLKNNPLYFANKTLFPLVSNKEVYGYIEVQNTKRLKKIEKERIKETLQLAFHSIFNDSLPRESGFFKHSRGLVNKISDFELKDFFPPSPHEEVGELEFKSISPADITIKKISWLIQAESNIDLIKAAHEIHELSKRFAFVHFSDIDKDKKTMSSVLEIGDTTLFIDDIEELSLDEQTVVFNVIKSSLDKTQSPKFIIGINNTLGKISLGENKLAQQLVINPHLKREVILPTPFNKDFLRDLLQS